MNNLYYLPIPNYSYPTYTHGSPVMYSTLPPLQCQESCCGTPAMYAPPSSACNLSCCTSSAPDIIINNPGNNPVYINNPGSATCTDSCCSSTVASTCNLSCCSASVGGFDPIYGYANAYQDTCDKTSSYYYRNGGMGSASVRYNKTPKSYYSSYGKGGCMMM